MKKSATENKFLHCLRTAICPEHEQERIDNILRFCLKHGVGNVMLFVNAEEYNVGHMTKEQARPWVETVRRAKKVFNSSGISVSLNFWISLGHLDRGRKLQEGQNFGTMTDFNGKSCQLVACPLDENWQAYYFDLIRYLIRETGCETFWVEDDFRLHNHSPLEFGGCFCDKHMSLYNNLLGANYSREEFVKKIFATGPLNDERKAWLDVSRNVMRELAQKIGQALRLENPDINVGLMSSSHMAHCIEARDWQGVFDGLSGKGQKIHRIHMWYALDGSVKSFYYNFNATSMAVRAFSPPDCLVYPEMEDCTFSVYSKDSEFLRFQIEGAMPLVLSGMTYDIFDFTGNGAVEKYGYGEAMQSVTPYIEGVMDLGIKFSDLTGIIVPIDEKASYQRTVKEAWWDLLPAESLFGAYLGATGINYVYSKKKRFKDKVVALAGGNAGYFSDTELEELFKNNFVVLDGRTALDLFERGLGRLISAEEAKLCPAESGLQSYEESDSMDICGISGFRASCHGQAGDYVRIEYSGNVSKRTTVYDHYRRPFGNGIAEGENFIVLPYVYNRLLFEMFSELRIQHLYQAIAAHNKSPMIFSDYSGIYLYLYQDDTRYVLIAVNSTFTDRPCLLINIKNIGFKQVFEVRRNDGALCEAPFEAENGVLKVFGTFTRMTTRTLVLKKA